MIFSIGRDDIVGGQRRAVVELHALPDLEGVGLAAVGRLRHLGAQVAHEIRRRGRIVRIDPDEHAVERRDRMDQRESRLAVAVPARRLVRHDEGQRAASLRAVSCRSARRMAERQGSACRQHDSELQTVELSLSFLPGFRRAPSSRCLDADLRAALARSLRPGATQTSVQATQCAGPHLTEFRHRPARSCRPPAGSADGTRIRSADSSGSAPRP